MLHLRRPPPKGAFFFVWWRGDEAGNPHSMTVTPSIEWSDSLSVGDPRIDGEHRELVALFQRLADLSRRGDAQYLRATLDELVFRVGEHFDREEGIMRRHGYPGYAEHKQGHGALLQQVNRFMDLMDTEGAALPPEAILDFVGTWLIGHILHDDKPLGAWLAVRHGDTAA